MKTLGKVYMLKKAARSADFFLRYWRCFDTELSFLKDEYKNEPGSVIEVDFYNASSLLGLSDEEAVQCALRRYLQGSLPAFASAVVQDYNVTR